MQSPAYKRLAVPRDSRPPLPDPTLSPQAPSAASPWMPFEMSPFCCWGLPAALLALLFCPGEPVLPDLGPGVPDLACAGPEDGLPAPLALRGGVLTLKSPSL